MFLPVPLLYLDIRGVIVRERLVNISRTRVTKSENTVIFISLKLLRTGFEHQPRMDPFFSH